MRKFGRSALRRLEREERAAADRIRGLTLAANGAGLATVVAIFAKAWPELGKPKEEVLPLLDALMWLVPLLALFCGGLVLVFLTIAGERAALVRAVGRINAWQLGDPPGRRWRWSRFFYKHGTGEAITYYSLMFFVFGTLYAGLWIAALVVVHGQWRGRTVSAAPGEPVNNEVGMAFDWLLQHPLATLLFCGIGLLAVWLVSMAWKYRDEVILSNWWDRLGSATAVPKSYEEVRRLIADDFANVASDQKFGRRGRPWTAIGWAMPRQLTVVILAAGMVWASARLVYDVADKPPNSMGDPLALASMVVGLGAVVLSIHMASTQSRTKVLSENRQTWINRLRSLLARIGSQTELQLLGNPVDPSTIDLQALVMIELLLNPAEPAHRALVALLRLAGGRVRQEIDGPALCGLKAAQLDLGRLDHCERLQIMIVRLSTLVLKREWEKVKRVQ